MPEAIPAPPAGRRRELLPLWLAVAAYTFGIGLVTPLLALVLTDAGTRPGVIGANHATGYLGLALGIAGSGAVLRRQGSRGAIRLGLLLSGTALAAMALPVGLPGLFALRLLHGLGGAWVYLGAETRMIARGAPETRGIDLGLYAALYGAGYAIAPATGTTLLALGRWVPFAAAGGLLAVAGLLLALWIAPEGPAPASRPATPKPPGATRALRAGLAGAFGLGFLEVGFLGLLPVHLRDLGVSHATIGLQLSVASAIAAIAAPPLAGRLCDRTSPVATLLGLSGLTCALALALIARGGPPPTWLLALYAAAWAPMYTVGVAAAAAGTAPEAFGRINARLLLAFAAGSLVGPALAGPAMGAGGGHALFAVAAGLAAAQALVIGPGRRGG